MDLDQQQFILPEPDVHDPAPGTEFIEDSNFSYEGYEVVRGEFFSHIYEPSVSFKDCRVQFNTACLKKMPSVEYVQFLINPNTKKMVALPCDEDTKDGYAWCTRNGKRKPREIRCKLFFAKLFDLMGWNHNYRYKLLGNIVRCNGEYLLLFDLTATEVYQRTQKEGEKPKTSKTPIFPEHWKNQFGLPVDEHKKSIQVNLFDGYTVFTVPEENTPSTPTT